MGVGDDDDTTDHDDLAILEADGEVAVIRRGYQDVRWCLIDVQRGTYEQSRFPSQRLEDDCQIEKAGKNERGLTSCEEHGDDVDTM